MPEHNLGSLLAAVSVAQHSAHKHEDQILVNQRIRRAKTGSGLLRTRTDWLQVTYFLRFFQPQTPLVLSYSLNLGQSHVGGTPKGRSSPQLLLSEHP